MLHYNVDITGKYTSVAARIANRIAYPLPVFGQERGKISDLSDYVKEKESMGIVLQHH